MNNEVTKNMGVTEFLNIWMNLNNPELSIPTDHLSDAITRVKEMNQSSFDKINKAHTDIKRNHATLDKEKSIVLENGNWKYTREEDALAVEEMLAYNADEKNNVDFKCWIKAEEKLPKRLFNFQYDLIKKFNGILYQIDLDKLLDDTLTQK